MLEIESGLKQAQATLILVRRLADIFLPKEYFVSEQSTVQGLPLESRLKELQMTFSLDYTVDFPDSTRDWCQQGSRPGVRITKRLKDPQNPSQGWEVLMDRVALLSGKVDEGLGAYESFRIDLASNELTQYSSDYLTPQHGEGARGAYDHLLLFDLNTIRGSSLADASFVARSSSGRYRLIT